MPITVDGAATSIIGTAIPLTFAWTSGADAATQLLIVNACWDNRNAQTVTGVTWNGQALISIGVTNHSGTKASNHSWYLPASLIAVSTTANVVITWSGAASGKPYVGGAVSYTSVDQATPVSGYAGVESTTSPISVNITSAVDDLVHGSCTAYKASSVAANGGETQHWTQANGTEGGAASMETGAASVNMSWAVTSAGAMNVATGFSLKAGISANNQADVAATQSAFTGAISATFTAPTTKTASANLQDSGGTAVADGLTVAIIRDSDNFCVASTTTAGGTGLVSYQATMVNHPDYVFVLKQQVGNTTETLCTPAITPV